MASQAVRITLKAYDHRLVDQSVGKIIETIKETGSQASRSVPSLTKKEVVTILYAVYKYKDSREQLEQRAHKGLTDIIAPSQKTVDTLSRLEMPTGVYIDIKMKTEQYLFSRENVYILKGLNYRSNTAFPVEELAYRTRPPGVSKGRLTGRLVMFYTQLDCSRMNAKVLRYRS